MRVCPPGAQGRGFPDSARVQALCSWSREKWASLGGWLWHDPARPLHVPFDFEKSSRKEPEAVKKAVVTAVRDEASVKGF